MLASALLSVFFVTSALTSARRLRRVDCWYPVLETFEEVEERRVDAEREKEPRELRLDESLRVCRELGERDDRRGVAPDIFLEERVAVDEEDRVFIPATPFVVLCRREMLLLCTPPSRREGMLLAREFSVIVVRRGFLFTLILLRDVEARPSFVAAVVPDFPARDVHMSPPSGVRDVVEAADLIFSAASAAFNCVTSRSNLILSFRSFVIS